MAKKHKHEEHENHERWLVSYADFITLLFAFFVVMYSISRTDMAKAAKVAKSVRFAMHFEGTGGVGAMPIFDGPPSEGGCMTGSAGGPRAAPDQLAVVNNMRRRIERRLKPFLEERSASGAVMLEEETGRLAIRLAAARFFDPSQAALRPEMMPVLDAIAAELLRVKQHIRVEGHTDRSPVSTARFRNNWDLSATRAVSVVTYLESVHKLPPSQLSAVGFADTRPVVKEESPEAAEKNRRIEIVIEVPPGANNAFPVR